MTVLKKKKKKSLNRVIYKRTIVPNVQAEIPQWNVGEFQWTYLNGHSMKSSRPPGKKSKQKIKSHDRLTRSIRLKKHVYRLPFFLSFYTFLFLFFSFLFPPRVLFRPEAARNSILEETRPSSRPDKHWRNRLEEKHWRLGGLVYSSWQFLSTIVVQECLRTQW